MGLRETFPLSVTRHPKTLGLRTLVVALSLSAVALAGNLRYSASHLTSKTPDEVWRVLTAYDQVCDEGCKYQRKDLVQVKRLSYRRSPTSWYTWTHVTSTLKDVKYFTHVSFQRDASGSIVADNRQVDSKELIASLEKSTGLKHSPAFDKGNTHTIISSTRGGKTKLTLTLTLSASGFLAMWEGKIRKNMKAGLAQTFLNIGK